MFFPRKYFPTAFKNNRKILAVTVSVFTLVATVLATYQPAVNAFALMTLGIPAIIFLILELKQ